MDADTRPDFDHARSPSFNAKTAENPRGTSIEDRNGCMAMIPLRNHPDPTPQLHQI
jgi:hypothetical protein